MRNLWKWIMGILLVLAILAIPFVLHSAFGYRLGFDFDGGHGPMMRATRGWEGPMPRDFEGGRHGPMMGFRGGRLGLFGPFLFLGGLVKLAFLGALLYGAYWLGRRNARVVFDSSTPPAGRQAPSATLGTVAEPEAAPQRERKTDESE